MINTQLIAILFSGIILIKIFWLYTETKYFKNRVNFQMFKTNAVELLILILQVLAVYYFPLPLSKFDNLFLISGVLMYISGMILALWARSSMNKVWGIPAEHAEQQDKLVTTGPFRISRNPIYLGFLLIYFGFPIAIKSWLFFLRIPLVIYFYKSAKREEKLLEEKFGKEFIEYKSRVPLIL